MSVHFKETFTGFETSSPFRGLQQCIWEGKGFFLVGIGKDKDEAKGMVRDGFELHRPDIKKAIRAGSMVVDVGLPPTLMHLAPFAHAALSELIGGATVHTTRTPAGTPSGTMH